MGGVPILPLAVPSSAWRGVRSLLCCCGAIRPRAGGCPGWLWWGSGSLCQLRVCSCVLGRCTRSVGNTPLLFGCSAPYRVQRPISGVAPPIGCSASDRVQCPISGAVPPIGCSASDRVQCPLSGAAPPCFWQLWRPGMRASPGLERLRCLSVPCSGFCVPSCCGSSEMSHAIPM